MPSGSRPRCSHPRLGAVAISVTTTALDRVSGLVCGELATRARSRGSGVVWRVSRWVGLVLRWFGLCGSCVCRMCPAPPGVFEPVPGTGNAEKRHQRSCLVFIALINNIIIQLFAWTRS